MQKSSAPGPTPIEVVIGIVYRDDSFLISQRRADQHLGSFWEFPGGKRKAGESELQTLQREFREELALDIVEPRFFDRLDYAYPDRNLRLTFYLCRPGEQAEPQALQVDQFKWVAREDLKNYRFPPANRPVLEKLAAFFS